MDEIFERLLADDRHIVWSGTPDAVPTPGGDPRAVVDDGRRLVTVIGPSGAETPLVVQAGVAFDDWTTSEDYETLFDEERCGVVVTSGDVVLGLVLRSDLWDAAIANHVETTRGSGGFAFDFRTAGDPRPIVAAIVRCGAPASDGNPCGYDNRLFDALPPYGRCGNTAIGAHDIVPLDEP